MPNENIGQRESRLKTSLRRAGSLAAKAAWSKVPRSLFLENSALHLALTRICNARCVFCPIDKLAKEDGLHMSDAVFQRVIDGLKHTHYRSAHLSPDVGEPLLAPDFHDKVRALRGEGIEFIEVTTNGTFLKRVGIDKLLEPAGPDEINLSFPGFDEEMYRRVYRTKKYQITRDNIMTLLRENERLGHPKNIQLWLRGDLPIEQVLAAPEMEEVNELADAVSYMTEVDSWLGLIDQDRLTGQLKLQKESTPLTKRPCALVFNLKIYPDGSMHLCSCRNISKDPDLELGNLTDISLREALDRIPGVLDRWERGQFPKSCRSCMMYNDPADAILGQVRATAKQTLSQGKFPLNILKGRDQHQQLNAKR